LVFEIREHQALRRRAIDGLGYPHQELALYKRRPGKGWETLRQLIKAVTINTQPCRPTLAA
jgi:hypothetical protein